MSGFGPPPGAPAEDPRGTPRPYLPPGGLGLPTGSGMPDAHLAAPADLLAARPDLLAAPGASPTAYRRGASWHRGSARPLLATAHRPGIISLRPMSVPDVLDGAVRHVRRNLAPVMAVTLLTLAAAVVPSVLVAAASLGGSWYSDIGVDAVVGPAGFSTLLLVLGVCFAALVLAGLLSHSVAEATLGRRAPPAEQWAAVRGRLGPLLALQLLVLAAVVVPAVALVVVVAALGNGPPELAVGAAGAGGLSLLGWWLFAGTRTLLAGPVLVLEGRGVRDALARGWALSAGSFWRLAGAALLVTALAALVFVVVQLPLLLLGTALTFLVDLTPSVEAFVRAVVVNLATLLAAAVVLPFVAGATVLLYVDQRMRKEGFDLVLLRAASSGGRG